MVMRSPGLLPTRRLALLVLAASPVWLLSGSRAGAVVAAVVTLAVLALALADAVRLPSRAHVELGRALPASAGLADEIPGTYVLRSRWPRALRGVLHDRLPAGMHRVDGAPLPCAVAAAGEAALQATFVGRVRGTHALGPVALRVIAPFGLVQRTLRYAPEDRITIAPSVAGVRRFRLLAAEHRLREMGVRTVRRRGGGTAFAGLREYAVGDDPRRIDWKATARRDALITREFTAEQGQTVMIAVDAGRLMTQLVDGDVARFEYALSSALVLADVAAESGDQVGLIVFDDEVRAYVPPAKGAVALQRLRDALVPVQATMTEPDYAAAFRTLATRHRRRSLLVIFTDVIDARASQSLIAHTTRGAARHLPLVVALRNDALVAAARVRESAGARALYESAAAEELLGAREDALGRMRQAGVSVVDVSPRAMTAAVVNRYLELKARGAV
jgi:uncharacterized protein (DUF58 family)